MLREGMFLADRYEVLEKIGSGGMSDVYKAKCHKLNRFVAIKVLKPEFCEDKTFVSKFRAEAQSAAGLMHSNIVNVYDVGEENGIYYIIMELVEGITLKKYIEKKGRLGVREAVSVAIQVAQGIEAAHKHHVVHRDIKPQNIIISKEGKVKVTDFGIARAASSNTINSTVMGSVHYISPEQARGGYSDEKSDIYSFGVMLFEMLTGRVPFEGDTTVAIALQHIQDDMVSPKKYLPDIPVSVEKIVLKCTQKKTDRRYQNMTDLIADLKRSLVTPDEDFVVISSAVVPGGATQLIGDEDIAEINKKITVHAADEDTDDSDEEYTDEDSDISEEEVDYVNEEEDDADGYERRMAASKKIDTVITILGIVVGVIILTIAIIVISKMAELFKRPSSSTPIVQTSTADDGKIAVPNILGRTYDEAKQMLNDVGLGISPVEEYSDLYPEGQIFNLNYNVGTRVEPNTTIVVYISKGVASFAMPDVEGRQQSEADAILRDKLLLPTYKFEDTDDKDKAGTVLYTDPAAGSMVKPGDKVVVTIYKAKGQAVSVVPDVRGMSKEDAEAELKTKGFLNLEYNYEYDDEVAEDVVISQGGAAIGGEADIETTITLVISKGPAPTEETSEETSDETTDNPSDESTSEETEAPSEGQTTEPPTEGPSEDSTTVAYNTFVGTFSAEDIKSVADSTYTGTIKVMVWVKDSEGFSKKVSSLTPAVYGDLHAVDLSAVDSNITGFKAGTGEAWVELEYTGGELANVQTAVKNITIN